MLIQYMFFSEINPIPSKDDRLKLLDKSINFLTEYRAKFDKLSESDAMRPSRVHSMMFNSLKFACDDTTFILK